MIYKPNFCCNCGEKIERVEWNFSNSRRFCDVCQTEFFVEDWLPTVLAGVMAMIGLFGVGTYFKAASAPPPAAFSKPAPVRNANRNSNVAADQTPSPANRNIANFGERTRPTPEPTEESAEFCGALTKKGTSCTRRVKGGGRCWQHKDQPPPAGNSKTRAAP
ncbi:MAG: hypothetical protein IPN69_17885 [Acidobacteria bacterium]|nr:hypothetical protein [Acidobacteriota bacterium]